jgi:hypothetical protein
MYTQTKLCRKEVKIMHTLFESKSTKKAKITIQELESQKSSILPSREELQVMDFSNPYLTGMPAYYGNSMNYGSTNGGNPYMLTGYDPNAFSQQSFTGFQPQTQQFPMQQMQFQPMQFQPQVVPPTPQYDFTHVTGYQSYGYGSMPTAYHAQSFAYDPNCDFNQGNWGHNGTTSWNGGDWNNGPGNSDWGHSHNGTTSVKPWNPEDWNNYQFKAYPYNGTALIYPNPAFNAA